MLTPDQADKIAEDCIRRATGFSGPIKPNSVLEDIGVIDDVFREAVNDEIVTNEVIGVKGFGHRLGESDLTFTKKSKFFELSEEIEAKAKFIPPGDPNEAVVLSDIAKIKQKKGKKKKIKTNTNSKNSKKEESKK